GGRAADRRRAGGGRRCAGARDRARGFPAGARVLRQALARVRVRSRPQQERRGPDRAARCPLGGGRSVDQRSHRGARDDASVHDAQRGGVAVKVSRRTVLKGLGGAALALPVLESLSSTGARAADASTSFAVFFRQASGVACRQDTEVGEEPERFWPTELGPLTEATMAGRAVDELSAYAPRLLIVKNVNMMDFNYGDGHARGALQGLTARGPTVEEAGGDSEAAGESIDHRIGRELNPDGRDSLFLYAGP